MVVFGKLFRFSLAHGPVKAKNERTFQLGSGLAIRPLLPPVGGSTRLIRPFDLLPARESECGFLC